MIGISLATATATICPLWNIPYSVFYLGLPANLGLFFANQSGFDLDFASQPIP